MDNWQKLLIVGGIGLALIIVSRVIKRGRLPEDDPSAAEKGLFLLGIVGMAVALLILMFRCDTLMAPEDAKDAPKEIKSFQDKAPGCSKPKDKKLGDFKP